MKKLSKSEFMTRVINDLSNKKYAEKKRQNEADRHLYANSEIY